MAEVLKTIPSFVPLNYLLKKSVRQKKHYLSHYSKYFNMTFSYQHIQLTLTPE